MSMRALILAVGLLAFGGVATAQNIGVMVQPNAVRLEQYIGGSLALWSLPVGPFPGTNCNSVLFTGPTSETSRVAAIVLAAKASARSFGLFLNATTCAPVSVFLD
jgi:hypothetical protein